MASSRIDTNRLGEMDVFVRVVGLCGFSPAARALRLSPSAVSKLIARLEVRLGARLFNRSTRKLALTAEGSIFYERCVRILADVDSAEREAAAGAVPRGRLRVNCNTAFSQWMLTPIVPEFLVRYPEIVLDLVVSDVVVDLLQEHADVAIRVGPLANSSLIARKLGESKAIVVAFACLSGTRRHAENAGRSRRSQSARLRLFPADRRLAVSRRKQAGDTHHSAGQRTGQRRRHHEASGACRCRHCPHGSLSHGRRPRRRSSRAAARRL